jgi:cytochrome c oxidase cbb3-type subunit I/II
LVVRNDLNNKTLPDKIRVMQKLGVPYVKDYDKTQAQTELDKQAKTITDDLKANKIDISSKKEIIAVIAYLQRLGTDIKAENK